MSRLAARSTGVLALALLAIALAASSGTAAAPTRVPILGVVPHAPQFAAPLHALATPFAKAAAPNALTFDTSYETFINQYLTDVAADSGGGPGNNVYGVATQYYDHSGPIQYESTFGGSYVARDPLPANGCSDNQDSYCLTDDQLQAEIQTVLTATGWHGSNTNVFFLITPNGVGSCFDSFSNECTTTASGFCAYHSAFLDSNDEPVIYANEPYMGPSDGCTDGSQGFPNDRDSDTTINTMSHEHNEAITDPFGDAWISADDNENGDLCAYGFGTQAGGTPGVDAYNQTIHGHHYELQQEYSNSNGGCIQHLGGAASATYPGTSGPLLYRGGQVMHSNTTYAIYWLPTPGSTSAPVVTGAAGINQTLTTSNGGWTGAPASFSDQWQRCSAAGTSCVDIPGATASTYTLTSADVGSAVRSTVHATNVNGTTVAPSVATPAVVPVPVSTAAPVISGVAAAHKRLSATAGTWNTKSAVFTYQWLRCAANGTSCATIPHATASTRALVAADAGHTFEARVTATNAAGTATAVSKHSAIVIDAPAARKAPHVSGRAHVGRKLSGTRGTWTYKPTAYRYQWLRCNAHGGACSSIRRATHPTYRPSAGDAGHRLRLRVTASNAAGRGTATSRPTASVPG
jgi:hypothetical protein